jgi:hypothetical protein
MLNRNPKFVLKLVRMKDALDLARIELDRKTPESSNALKHVR